MLANGIEHQAVSSIIGKSVKTIENWFHQYRTKGIDSLEAFQYKSRKTLPEKNQVEELVKWVKEANPAKTKQVREYIKADYIGFWGGLRDPPKEADTYRLCSQLS
jgi:transposase